MVELADDTSSWRSACERRCSIGYRLIRLMIAKVDASNNLTSADRRNKRAARRCSLYPSGLLFLRDCIRARFEVAA